MRTSYHVHTTITHGKSSIDELVQRALELELDELGFAEHYVLVPPEVVDWRMEPTGLQVYCDAVLAARDRVKGMLTVRLGLEADFIPSTTQELFEAIQSCPFDYIIGSVHFVEDFAIDRTADLWEALTQAEINDMVRAYWATVKQMAESRLFDIVGHLDLYKKFGHGPTIDVTEDIAAALDAIAGADMAVELNASGIYKAGEIYPAPPILRECHKRGIPSLVTTDAHHADELMRGYDEGVKALRDAGYTQQAVFERRKRTMVAL